MLRVNSLKINKNIYEGITAFAFPGGLVGLCCCCGVTPSVCIGQRAFLTNPLETDWLGVVIYGSSNFTHKLHSLATQQQLQKTCYSKKKC